MEKEVTITAEDGKSFKAFVAVPDTDLPAPAIVVIQEIFGVNDVMKGISRQLARAGYIAICPDLFWRQEPGVVLTDQTDEEWARAFELFKGFDIDQGVEDLKSTLAFIRNDKDCMGKVGTVGYCLGGKLAFLMATRSDADCNISYYGVDIHNHLDEAESLQSPLLMHIAEQDEYVPLEAQEKIIHTLNDHPMTDIHVYPGVNHAFARNGGKHYDKEAAHQADFRTSDFLATFLSDNEE